MGQSIYKLIVVGASGVGKTSIVQRLVDKTFISDAQPTIGVEFKSYQCRAGTDVVKLNIWDTAGQEKFRSVSKAYFRNAVGALLVFSLTDRVSFDSLEGWLNDIHSLCSPNAVIIVVGNKLDLPDDRVVSKSDALTFSERHQIDFIETSARDCTNIEETFLRMGETIHERVLKKEIKGSFQTTPVAVVLSPEAVPATTERGLCC
jgi:small GTP-binding protein